MERSNSQSVPLQQLRRGEWTRIFNECDADKDGRVSYCELWALLRKNNHGIPHHVIRKIHEKSDRNDDGYLSYEEFVHMVEDPDNHALFKHYLKRYVDIVCPHRRAAIPLGRSANITDEIDGLYEDEYTCCPPPLSMIIISIVEIIFFAIDAAKGAEHGSGPIAGALMYDPHRRREAWRFVTYMFVHIGYFHLFVNLFVQIMLGTPLEMVHRGWRVLIIYFAGVLAGSLGTSIMDPTVRLAGASGGVYSLITAHIATIAMNWKEMTYPIVQLMVFVLVTVTDVGTAIYNRYVLNKDENIGYAAHFAGALAGLLIGITLLRNLEVTPREKIVQKVAFVLYILLMGIAIVWHLAVPGYFPEQYV